MWAWGHILCRSLPFGHPNSAREYELLRLLLIFRADRISASSTPHFWTGRHKDRCRGGRVVTLSWCLDDWTGFSRVPSPRLYPPTADDALHQIWFISYSGLFMGARFRRQTATWAGRQGVDGRLSEVRASWTLACLGDTDASSPPPGERWLYYHHPSSVSDCRHQHSF